MNVFLSHNSADKDTVRALAMLLAGEGVNLFFDEWDIRLGDPLMGTIERGIQDADIFVIVWSNAARESNWVDVEVQTFLRRRIDNQALRVIPLMMDGTPLPALLANYAGLNIAPDNPQGNTLETVVRRLVGDEQGIQLAQRLQRRLNELTEMLVDKNDPFGLAVCPTCSSDQLHRSGKHDPVGDEFYYFIECKECGYSDWTQ